MQRRGQDDVVAPRVAAVDAGADLAVAERPRLEQELEPAAAGLGLRRPLRDQPPDPPPRRAALGLVEVDIDRVEIGCRDSSLRVLRPPLLDLLTIGRGVLEAVRREGNLPVYGEDVDSRAGVEKRHRKHVRRRAHRAPPSTRSSSRRNTASGMTARSGGSGSSVLRRPGERARARETARRERAARPDRGRPVAGVPATSRSGAWSRRS